MNRPPSTGWDETRETGGGLRQATPAVKLCGITRAEDALFAASLGIQALGFIFYPPSPRYISPEGARAIIGRLPAASNQREGPSPLPSPVFPFPGRAAAVGVFVNETPERNLDIAAFCDLDLIQLHGDESPEMCRAFPRERVVKALTLSTEADLERLEDYPVRAILVDCRDQGRYGGTGKRADWDLAARAAARVPLILAGGLAPDVIATALATVRPAAVDINSGVESAPGIKDHEKIRAILDRMGERDIPN